MLRWLLLVTAALGCGESKKAEPAAGAATGAEEASGAEAGTASGSGAATGAASGAAIATYMAAVDKSCDAGITSSCWYQGIVYARGLLGQAIDPARAADYFKRGCDDKLRGPGCPEIFAAQKELTEAERESVDWWCSQGRRDACALSTDPQKGYHMCNAGDVDACASLDPSGAKDGEAQVPLLPPGAGPRARQAAATCDAGGSFGCAILAAAYLEGARGLPRDLDRAFALGMRSCDAAGATLGCYPAAAAQLASGGGGKTATAMMLLAKQGCDRGDMRACALIAGEMSRSAETGMRQQALGYFLRACYLDPTQKQACADFERAVPRAVE